MKLKSKKRKGIALMISIFIGVVAALLTITMMTMSSSNTSQIVDNKSGSLAYYAAESGIEEVKYLFNSDSSLLGESLASLDLPKEETPAELNNGATYWVDSIEYANSNQTALIYIVGNFGDAFRKIRAKLDSSIPGVYDDYGLLTDGKLTIHGSKTLWMSVHANNGLDFTGGTTMQNGSIATQSNNPNALPPDADSNKIGGYVASIDVPVVPIDEYRTKSKSNNYLFDIKDTSLTTKIMATPTGSNIYISGFTGKTKDNKTLNLTGDMGGRFIFLDGDANLNAEGYSDLSNVMVVSSGKLTIDGSRDVATSHSGKIDVVFACNDDVTLNGSRSFKSLFWTNGIFRQNGSSMAGRVIAQEAIVFNGSFTLTPSDRLYDNNAFDKSMNVSTWQVVPMN